MLYKIRDGVSVYEDNPELWAIPEFANLYNNTPVAKDEDRDRRMRYVILYADRKSPLKTLPDKQRKEKAAIISGYKMEGDRPNRNARDIINGQVEAVEKAIAMYKELQYDENQDALDSKTNLIQSNLDFINSVNNRTEKEKKDKQYGKDLELANKLGKQLPELYKSKIELEQLLNVSQENKPEVTTFTSLDITEEAANEDENMSTTDLYWRMQRNNERSKD